MELPVSVSSKTTTAIPELRREVSRQWSAQLNHGNTTDLKESDSRYRSAASRLWKKMMSVLFATPNHLVRRSTSTCSSIKHRRWEAPRPCLLFVLKSRRELWKLLIASLLSFLLSGDSKRRFPWYFHNNIRTLSNPTFPSFGTMPKEHSRSLQDLADAKARKWDAIVQTDIYAASQSDHPAKRPVGGWTQDLILKWPRNAKAFEEKKRMRQEARKLAGFTSNQATKEYWWNPEHHNDLYFLKFWCQKGISTRIF